MMLLLLKPSCHNSNFFSAAFLFVMCDGHLHLWSWKYQWAGNNSYWTSPARSNSQKVRRSIWWRLIAVRRAFIKVYWICSYKWCKFRRIGALFFADFWGSFLLTSCWRTGFFVDTLAEYPLLVFEKPQSESIDKAAQFFSAGWKAIFITEL